jgi:hypothetical protein
MVYHVGFANDGIEFFQNDDADGAEQSIVDG